MSVEPATPSVTGLVARQASRVAVSGLTVPLPGSVSTGRTSLPLRGSADGGRSDSAGTTNALAVSCPADTATRNVPAGKALATGGCVGRQPTGDVQGWAGPTEYHASAAAGTVRRT